MPEAEVSRILALAASSGISLLIRRRPMARRKRCWGTAGQEMRRALISKLTAEPRQSWEESLITSLRWLQAPKLDAFLLHRASDCSRRMERRLIGWRVCDRGLRIELVFYFRASDLEGLPWDRLQLVQLPLSVFDQRLTTWHRR